MYWFYVIDWLTIGIFVLSIFNFIILMFLWRTQLKLIKSQRELTIKNEKENTKQITFKKGGWPKGKSRKKPGEYKFEK